MTELERKRIFDKAREADEAAAKFLREQNFYDDHNERIVEADVTVDVEAETLRRQAEERRERRELRLSAVEATLRNEIEAVRQHADERDVKILNALDTAVFPALEKIANNLRRRLDELQGQVKEIGARVDRELRGLREEIRGEIKRERTRETIDLPSWRN
jgi:hypothetical protein